jgi:hypothetical protein
MVHGGGTVLLVYRVLFSGPCIRLVSGFMPALLHVYALGQVTNVICLLVVF